MHTNDEYRSFNTELFSDIGLKFAFCGAISALAVSIFAIIVMPNLNLNIYAVDIESKKNLSAELQNSSTLIVPSEISSLDVMKGIPEFVFYDNFTGLLTYGSSTFWKDPRQTCFIDFNCIVNTSIGSIDSPFLEISTNSSKNFTFSWITGEGVGTIPGERYLLTTQMEVNEYTLGSHIVLEGYNESSRKWLQLVQCPAGTDGPKDWQMFRCVTTISPNITKVRPVLAAGWTSSGVNEATTRFGNVYLNYMDASPVLLDNSLKTEIVYENMTRPSSMAFLGDEDFLILEKDSGTVERITNGTKHDSPLIDLNVTSADGLIGIAVDELPGNVSQVYLYYSANSDGDCGSCVSIGNKLVRYNLVNNKTALVNPKVLLDLPAPDNTSAMHNGGPVLIGPDNNIYLSVGDLHSIPESGTGNATYNQAINYPNGSYADGRAGILRISKDGSSVGQIGILGDSNPLSLYFAYGIRNSFGMDFDPVSGKLWITENGPDLGDEINLVEAGFNGGWAALAGSTIMSNNTYYSRLDFPSSLFDFDGKGHYRSPEFEWKNTIGPTAMSFIDSKLLGDKYENALFVADWLGNLYLFQLSENRSGLLLEEELYDKIADTPEETEINKIGEGFGLVTDLKMGMDGSLYLVSLVPGKVYKIMLRE